MAHSTVLLISGGAGTGKSTVAEAVGKKYAIPIYHTDHIRQNLQRNQASDARISQLIPETVYTQLNQEQLIQLHIQISTEVFQAVLPLITSHSRNTSACIIEGDDLLPSLYSKYLQSRQVKALCIYELDQDRIFERIRQRDTDKNKPNKKVLENQYLHAYHYGQYIYEEAEKYGVTCVASTPEATIVERVTSIWKPD